MGSRSARRLIRRREAIRLRPRDAPAHSNLAAAYLRKHEPEKAVRACRDALAIDPKLADAHLNLGTALAALGRHGPAVEAFRAAAGLRPRHAATFSSWPTP